MVCSLGAVMLLFVYPKVGLLPDRTAETRFEQALHVGMSRTELARLDSQIHWSWTRPVNVSLEAAREYKIETDKGVILAWFVDWRTFCSRRGHLYHLRFNQDDELSGWNVSQWSDAC